MNLAVFQVEQHKTLSCQGEVSDAFVKSKYYDEVLIILKP